MSSVYEACQALLTSGTLEAKLAFPAGELTDDAGVPIVDVEAPTRAPLLAMHEGSERLPPLHALASAEARVVCLSRFAHHELMAAELFAWALLRFPDAPPSLRRGWVAALREELVHLRLYLARLEAHGAALGDLPLSGYFWKLMPGVRQASDPLRAFVCMQGLTLEQANLDFTILYRDAFRRSGDQETAAVLQRVHDDEIAHVRLARVWLVRGDSASETDGGNDLDLYRAHVPFPLSAARAKGRRFETGARRRAGLSEAFIAHVREATPYVPRSPLEAAT
jgi:uncharacterized ferritin-like protein (DUF455 family)